jgi:methyl-accepting chemotaxis protein
VVEKHLPALLQDFYAHLRKQPALAALLNRGPGDASLVSRQTVHWKRLFTGDFEGLAASARKVGEIHYAIGLEPIWYQGGYAIILPRLLAIADESVKGAEKQTRTRAAVTAAVLLDTVLALAAYNTSAESVALRSEVNAFADRLMDNSVRISISLTQASVASARAFSDVREVDQHVQLISAATEELVASVSEISQRSRDTSTQAEHAMGRVNSGRASVERALAAMTRIVGVVREATAKVSELTHASNHIKKIVGSIETIANQTKLLALNARIEAARAGEAGRGFAVVASEVKALSAQTAQATDNIRQQIESLREELGEVVARIGQTSTAVDEGEVAMREVEASINAIMTDVLSTQQRMAEVAHILQEQQSAAQEVAGGLATIAQRSQSNVSSVLSSVNANSVVDGVVHQQLDELTKYEVKNRVLRLAKTDHATWKRRLIASLLGLERMDAVELKTHHECRLGQWYGGEGRRSHGHHPEFVELEAHHRAIHEQGRRAYEHGRNGDMALAMRELDQMEHSSIRVYELLDALAAASSK